MMNGVMPFLLLAVCCLLSACWFGGEVWQRPYPLTGRIVGLCVTLCAPFCCDRKDANPRVVQSLQRNVVVDVALGHAHGVALTGNEGMRGMRALSLTLPLSPPPSASL